MRFANDYTLENDIPGYFFEMENADKEWLKSVDCDVPFFMNSYGDIIAPVEYSIREEDDMNIEWANADYTGGGLYAYIGKLKNGNYFMAADDWNEDESFVYEVDSEIVFDTFEDGDPAPWTIEWMDEHLVKTHSTKAFKQMLKWIITNKPDGNYDVEEIEERLK